MPSLEARVKALEKQVAALKKEAAAQKKEAAKQKKEIASNAKNVQKLQKDNDDVVTWIVMEAGWSTEVTSMLHGVNWGNLENAFPSGGGTNPPQPNPDWPPSDS